MQGKQIKQRNRSLLIKAALPALCVALIVAGLNLWESYKTRGFYKYFAEAGVSMGERGTNTRLGNVLIGDTYYYHPSKGKGIYAYTPGRGNALLLSGKRCDYYFAVECGQLFYTFEDRLYALELTSGETRVIFDFAEHNPALEKAEIDGFAEEGVLRLSCFLDSEQVYTELDLVTAKLSMLPETPLGITAYIGAQKIEVTQEPGGAGELHIGGQPVLPKGAVFSVDSLYNATERAFVALYKVGGKDFGRVFMDNGTAVDLPGEVASAYKVLAICGDRTVILGQESSLYGYDTATGKVTQLAQAGAVTAVTCNEKWLYAFCPPNGGSIACYKVIMDERGAVTTLEKVKSKIPQS